MGPALLCTLLGSVVDGNHSSCWKQKGFGIGSRCQWSGGKAWSSSPARTAALSGPAQRLKQEVPLQPQLRDGATTLLAPFCTSTPTLVSAPVSSECTRLGLNPAGWAWRMFFSC